MNNNTDHKNTRTKQDKQGQPKEQQAKGGGWGGEPELDQKSGWGKEPLKGGK